MTARCHVLVVDDDLEIRESVASILELEGHAVTTAANGAEALERLRSMASPNLVVLDLMMPIMSGWEFLARRATDETLPEVPVIVISAQANESPKGASAFLQKPFDLNRFLGLVERFCHHGQPAPS